jgi:hypothetical protein
MAGELVVMSTREIDRLGVVQQILERRLTRWFSPLLRPDSSAPQSRELDDARREET